MAFGLNETVARGEIDNRFEGLVVGRIWLAGRDDPITLDLQGNCLRDLAGSRFVFENLSPQPKDFSDLHPEQKGVVGDMTASRKVKTFDAPVEQAHDMRKLGKEIPLKLANCLYLEWYSERNGRVVIEITDFRTVEISDHVWRMTPEQEQRQTRRNVQAIHDYMESLDQLMAEARARSEPDGNWPMDEFEWEKALRESDELTDRSMEVWEKYDGHPDRDKLVAREMGWDWLDDALDADERGAFEQERAALAEEDFEPLEPNPLTEGKDWIRREGGSIVHPLCHRAGELAMGLWHYGKERGLLGEEGDDDLYDMYFETQTLGAKLAGALNGLAYEREPDAGFVVACLKRALQYVEAAIGASSSVAEKDILSAEYMRSYRREIFSIREEMLRLMDHFRSRI